VGGGEHKEKMSVGEYYIFMYKSGSIRPVETILRRVTGEESDGGGEFN
jgi:hypothetical protein